MKLISIAIAASVFTASAFAQPASPIRLNTLGYLPDAPKCASVAGKGGHFAVIRVSDHHAVFEGETSGAVHNNDTDEDIVCADFSALRDPGEYRLRIAGIVDSPPFRIAADLYREPLFLVTRAMYLWRCGGNRTLRGLQHMSVLQPELG